MVFTQQACAFLRYIALFKFTKKIINVESIDIYNHGDMRRNFTYIDDIEEAMIHIQDIIPE